MRLRPIEHLENRKMHTQEERQLTRFFVFYNWSTKKTKPYRRFFSKPNWNRNRTWGFSQNWTEPNLKNPFRTSLIAFTIEMSLEHHYYEILAQVIPAALQGNLQSDHICHSFLLPELANLAWVGFSSLSVCTQHNSKTIIFPKCSNLV